MPTIHACDLPAYALLHSYRQRGAYTDCYMVDVPYAVTHASYVAAFYSCGVFKVERQLIAWLLKRPASDAQAQALGAGTIDAFSAWTVEGRTANQLLLRDFQGRTRSWLLTESVDVSEAPGTRLFFGSAVVPRVDRRTGQKGMGLVFRALLGFHKLYSRVLLRAAVSRLTR